MKFMVCHGNIIKFVLQKVYVQQKSYEQNSTNEIDLLIRWTESARFSGISGAFPCFNESFLCECKNYKGKVGVTYVY